MNCPKCGEKLEGNEKYCPVCGTELDFDEETEVIKEEENKETKELVENKEDNTNDANESKKEEYTKPTKAICSFIISIYTLSDVLCFWLIRLVNEYLIPSYGVENVPKYYSFLISLFENSTFYGSLLYIDAPLIVLSFILSFSRTTNIKKSYKTLATLAFIFSVTSGTILALFLLFLGI